MEDLALFNEELETVKELADSLGFSERTIKDTAKKLGMEIHFHPLQTNKGCQKTICFNKKEATAIKIELQNHSKVAQNGFNTLSISNDLEAWELQKRLDAYKDRRIAELTAENELMKPKAVVYDNFVAREKFCNFRDGANYLKIPQSEFMNLLKTKYIYKNNAGEYRAYSEYAKLFTLRPFPKGTDKTGQQLMLTIDGLEFFRQKIKKDV